jgi:hypothetical protein
MNIGLVLAAIIGITAGALSERILSKKSEVSENE